MIQRALKWLPKWAHDRIAHRPGLLKILDNISWLFFDKILRMGVGLLVGVWVARYLGPEQFGLLSFALAFVGLFGAVATLGLHGIVVRDIVRDQTSASETLGTAFALQLLGGLTAYLLVLAAIFYFRPDDALARTIVAILGFTLVLKAGETIKYWFESQVQSKFVVWVENAIFLLIAGIKVIMILSKAPLVAFVWASLAETALAVVALLVIYNRTSGRLHVWKPGIHRAKTLLRDSWPLILSGMAVMVYMRIDQVMLGQMIGDEAVGIYSAAVRISEVWYFFALAIVSSVFPTLVDANKNSKKVYHNSLERLYKLVVLIAFALALPMTFFSEKIITTIFGIEYYNAGPVLSIHIWSSIFLYLNLASSKWYLIEELQILTLIRQILGVVSNILLNIFFIKNYGIVGAAWATLLSQAISGLIYDVFQERTRINFYFKLRALTYFWDLRKKDDI